MSRTSLYLTILVLAAYSGASQAQGISSENGLSTVTYETPEGNIKLNYPQVLLAGDRFTGTVMAEPRGGNEEEKTAFTSTISGYVVEVNDSVQTSTKQGSFQWTLPDALSALTLVLRDPGGNVVSRMEAPVLSGVDSAPGGFELPSIAQVGNPVQVPGPFDGDGGSTSITIGESPAGVLAESPRAAFFQAPSDKVGLLPITVTEDGVTMQGEFRVIGFAHELPKTNLLKGEKTQLTTTVHGLDGLDRPVTLRLVNHTPEIIGLQEGELEIITITPGDVSPEGTYLLNREITGRQQGDFELSLNLLSTEAKDPCEELGDAIDSVTERARDKELESDVLEDDAVELEDWADRIEEHPPSRWKELADYYGEPRNNETETEKESREETAERLGRLVKKLEELSCGETMRERRRAAKRLRQEAEDLNDKRDRLRAEAEKLREQADQLKEKHKECLEGQAAN
jgi:hypothetical protein